ncbi:40S ribosomal protein S2-like [Rattus rattus]|uniref:40S ribosomal protein S2-like n=1 Tax=Rattus rattus TaxID=10117 RepID=UPI0013F37824|nr:40S ribosomal protein S2-like [Rattus rattus]
MIIGFSLRTSLRDEDYASADPDLAAQQTWFKDFVSIRDYSSHVDLDDKCSKKTATAIVLVWKGTRETRLASLTVSRKVTGQCVSVMICLIPPPRNVLSAPVPKKLLLLVNIDDCYTSARGCTATLDNFDKATFNAISNTYSYLTPLLTFTNLCRSLSLRSGIWDLERAG